MIADAGQQPVDRMMITVTKPLESAVKASKILGITLTKSNGRKDDEGKPLAMAGFPYHALDTYLPKLIRAGA